MIANIESNKNEPFSNWIVLKRKKTQYFTCFYTTILFKVPKTITWNTAHFIAKIPNKRELRQIAWNHSSDIVLKDFIKLYESCVTEPFSFSVNNKTLL